MKLQLDKFEIKMLSTDRSDEILCDLVMSINRSSAFNTFSDVYQFSIDTLVDLVDEDVITKEEAFEILMCLQNYQIYNR